MQADSARSALEILCLATVVVAACSTPPPMALELDYDIVPLLKLDKRWAAPGSPLELTYRFEVAADNGPIDGDYEVSVDFVNESGEWVFSANHQPPTPTSSWAPGSVVQYTRTIFVPYDVEPGELTVELALVVPGLGRAIVLAGGDGQVPAVVSRAARLAIEPAATGVPIFYEGGWYGVESDVEDPSIRWQWTAGQALSSFPNPRTDAVIYLHAEARVVAGEKSPEVRVGVGPELLEVARFRVEQPGLFLQRIYVPATLMGGMDTVELRIATDKVFVPSEGGAGADSRRLGLRVFNLYIEPKPNWLSYHLGPVNPIAPGSTAEPYRGDYTFSEEWDRFSPMIPVWDEVLAPLKGRPNIHYLEVGVLEGRSYVWMAENVFTDPTSTLTAVDPFPEFEGIGGETIRSTFLDNVRRAGISNRSTVYSRSSQLEMREPPLDRFDVIYLDAVDDAAGVLEYAMLCRRLLEDGGILIFNDYDWPTDPGVKFAVDTFVRVYGESYSIVHRGYQLILRKGRRS